MVATYLFVEAFQATSVSIVDACEPLLIRHLPSLCTQLQQLPAICELKLGQHCRDCLQQWLQLVVLLLRTAGGRCCCHQEPARLEVELQLLLLLIWHG
jgi:hypothetical protein